MNKYHPNLKLPVLSLKSYAAHEQIVDGNETKRFKKMIETFKSTPKEKFDEPQITSQIYGWMKPVERFDAIDNNLFNYHRRYSDMTRFGEELIKFKISVPFGR